MGSSEDVYLYIIEKLSVVGTFTYKKMFGEYGVYHKEKLVGLICDNTLFIKFTPEGLSFCGDRVELAPPYEGAKPSFVISQLHLEDLSWLRELIQITHTALPHVKRKKRVTELS